MALDPSFVQLNRASTERIRGLVKRLTDADLQHPVGDGWTVAIVLAHLVFWDRRVLYLLDKSEREGKFVKADVDILVNDVSLPLWAAIPPRAAAQMAIDTADQLDKRLEAAAPALLEEMYAYNKRSVVRALHRNEHLDDVDQALKA